MTICRHIIFCSVLILACGFFESTSAQPGYSVDVKKPKEYENRVLRAEKTKEGKLKEPKKFLQNLATHFNYVFNANLKLNEVLDRAKSQHKDDYSVLLSFYNYDLNTTQRDSLQLDSVIYKSQSGIVLHDLRTNWGDDLYLLWGAAYFLRKDLDSAAMMFQFINYAYAEKEKDGYYIPVGTAKEGEDAMTIATKEKTGLFGNTTSRNNAFVWQVRTQTELGNYTKARSLISVLKADPNFPKRLYLQLEEVQAYLFYKLKQWDSSAYHLSIAANGAGTKQEKARWEYLAAQMYEKAGKASEAEKLYARAISHTTDPVMDVYARLNLVRINKSGGDDYISKNIAELLKMARRDKYEDYRDVIYYMAAQMEMERGDLDAAESLLLKGTKYNNGNVTSRSKAFLQIADLSYTHKKYVQAASFYDSVSVRDLADSEAIRKTERGAISKKIAQNILIVNRQDSLQRIAAMPEDERNAYLAKVLKQLRKARGLKEEPVITSGNPFATTTTSSSLFPSSQGTGEWYFYNSSLKTQGAQQFKQVWGTRPNVDNWRRMSDVAQQGINNNPANISDVNAPGNNSNSQANNQELDLNSLSDNLPLTPEKMEVSNDSIKNSLSALGGIYLNEAEDYASAIQALEELRKRFPDFKNMDEVLFNLYYAYSRSGDGVNAARIKKLLMEKYPSSRYASIVSTGKDPGAKTSKSPEATKAYEDIYNLFIQGKFAEALNAKKLADSTYKTNYWEPQLLYIEAVYHAQQREDSAATKVLQTLITQDPKSPLAKKAQALIDALAHRKQIEDELAKYQIQNQPEQTTPPPVVQQTPPVQQNQPTAAPKKDTVATVVNKPVQKPVDTSAKKVVPPPVASAFTYNASAQHYAIVILNKVDPVFVNEAKNAFFRFSKEKYYNLPLDVQIMNLDADNRILLIGNFPNAQGAIDYAQQAKRLAASEIVPWLTADKYTFSVITQQNLDILKANPDLSNYKKFLDQYVKF